MEEAVAASGLLFFSKAESGDSEIQIHFYPRQKRSTRKQEETTSTLGLITLSGLYPSLLLKMEMHAGPC